MNVYQRIVKENEVNKNEDNMQNISNFNDMTSLEMETARKFKSSLRFWEAQFASLVRDTAVVFTLSRDLKIFKMSPVMILKKLIQLDLLKELKGINLLSNKAYCYLRFATPEKAKEFREKVQRFEEYQVEFVNSKEETNEIWGTIDSVPPIDIVESLQHKLEGIAEVSDIKPSFLILPDGQELESTPTKFKLTLLPEKKIEHLPNVLFFGNMKSYLTINGKRRVCFNCEQNTHISRNCPMSFCKNCRKMVLTGHDCKITYADKVRITSRNFDQLIREAMEGESKEDRSRKDTGLEEEKDLSFDDMEQGSTSSDAASLETLPYCSGEQVLDENHHYEGNSSQIEFPDIRGAPLDTASQHQSMLKSEPNQTKVRIRHKQNKDKKTNIKEMDDLKKVGEKKDFLKGLQTVKLTTLKNASYKQGTSVQEIT